MEHDRQIELARGFHALHERHGAVLIPNAWDAGSAAILARLGFPAVATTSGGMAWSLGYPDGEAAPLAETLAAVARITRAVEVPVTVDFEAGYGVTPEAVGANVRALLEAGAVGLNLEDGVAHEYLREANEAAARIAAARAAAEAAGIPAFINARVDVWMVGHGADEAERIDEALRRAEAYLAAGADGVYPIGASDPATLARLCAEIPAPINVAARPGLAGRAELAELGVARITTATRLATSAYARLREVAAELRDSGCFDALAASFEYGHAQALFPPS